MPELFNIEEEKKYIYKKNVTCTNCDFKFDDIRVKSSKLRRLEPDQDLRPRFQDIDSLKYGITACPLCGYANTTKNFEHLTKLQRGMLKEKVSDKFVPRDAYLEDTIDYATALEQYKMALVCAMSMDSKLSEQAYLCLQIAWLIRSRIEQAQLAPGTATDKEIAQWREDEAHFYKSAYEGLSKAATKEDFPICGMDTSTFDYLLAVLAYRHGEYDMATKYCGNVVQTRGINARLKDKALTLKDEIAAEKKKLEEAEE